MEIPLNLQKIYNFSIFSIAYKLCYYQLTYRVWLLLWVSSVLSFSVL